MQSSGERWKTLKIKQKTLTKIKQFFTGKGIGKIREVLKRQFVIAIMSVCIEKYKYF